MSAAPDGVLPVDKPVGPTSHDVVALARRGLGTRRIGHTGTLDPFASGLLLLCIGQATRLAEYLTDLPKTYRATVRLGVATDTDDLTGDVIERRPGAEHLSEDDVRDALNQQTGEILQLPPRYSAKRVGGERLYAAARRGVELERTPVRVTIYRLEILEMSLPDMEIEVECSSGTYIRAIARDVGETLGVGGHLTALRRTRVGSHGVGNAISPEAFGDESAVTGSMISLPEAVSHLPNIIVDERGEKALSYGQFLDAPDEAPSEVPLAILSGDGRLLAIGERDGTRIRPRKVLQ
ncbi:MAG TPA: tRNA pseudouridine(55) synthase TruB [Longimicrobiaceae bacterium]|nr:tRNA pseudouridine(55) synthase TruB [Longimicrobiaceae bacterium]